MCVNTHIDYDKLNVGQVSLAAEILKLMSDPTRLKILWALLHGEHAVGELAEHAGVKPAAVSQHLAKLRAAQLVKVRREGNKKLYLTDNPHVLTLITEALGHADHIMKRNKQ